MDTSRYGWFWLQGKLEFPWGWSLMDSNRNMSRDEDIGGLLHVGGLGGLVQAELDHQGEGVQFLVNQMWRAAVREIIAQGRLGSPKERARV